VSDQVIVLLCQVSNFVAIFRDDDEVCFVLDQHAWLEFYNASLLKQQFTDKTCSSTQDT